MNPLGVPGDQNLAPNQNQTANCAGVLNGRPCCACCPFCCAWRRQQLWPTHPYPLWYYAPGVYYNQDAGTVLGYGC